MAGWFRPESAAASTGKPAAVAGASAARPVDRVLVGSGPDGAEARIRIGAGALAGTEIQLSSGGAGHVVEARLLTHAATSRQTLSLVMDENQVAAPEQRHRPFHEGGRCAVRAASGRRSHRRSHSGGAGRVGRVRPVNARTFDSRGLSARA
jgi:hypothetical protein